MTSLALKCALLVSYLGDYCSLIGLMEYAKKFGQSDKVIFIYIAYCIPPLIMLFFANKWAANQKKPTQQMAIFCILGVAAVLSLLSSSFYAHVILVTVVLGFVKEAIHVLYSGPQKQTS